MYSGPSLNGHLQQRPLSLVRPYTGKSLSLLLSVHILLPHTKGHLSNCHNFLANRVALERDYCNKKKVNFSSAWLCQQRSWNWNLSVVRLSSVHPSVSQFSLNLSAQISFKFWLLLPLGYTLRQFFFSLFFLFLRKFTINMSLTLYASYTSYRYMYVLLIFVWFNLSRSTISTKK